MGVLIPDQDVSGMLRLFADSIKANTDQLQTWQGAYRLTLTRSLSNPQIYVYEDKDADRTKLAEPRRLSGSFLRSQDVEGEFVADLANDRLYSSYRHSGDTIFRQLDGDGEFQIPLSPQTKYEQESILTGRDFYHVRQDVRYSRIQGFPALPEQAGGYRMIKREAPEQGHQLTRHSTVFDPRRTLQSGGRPHEAIFSYMASCVDDGSMQITIEHMDDGSYEVTHRYPGTTKVKTVREFDGQFLVTKSVLRSETHGTFQNTWDYSSRESVHWPHQQEYTYVHPNGEMKQRRLTVLQDVRFNAPVSEEDFAVTRFNPGPLDRFVDRIEGKVDLFADKSRVVSSSTFHPDMLPAGTEYIDVAAASASPLHVPLVSADGGRLRSLLIMANVILIAVVGGTLLWQRHTASS